MKREMAIILASALLLASFTHAACASEQTDWVKQGDKYLDEGNYAKAVQAYDEALAIDPENAAAWYEKGYALNELGRYGEALQASNEAIVIDPKYAAAWYEKGYALSKLGKYKEALRAVDKALSIDPNNKNAKDLRSEILDAISSRVTQ